MNWSEKTDEYEISAVKRGDNYEVSYKFNGLSFTMIQEGVSYEESQERAIQILNDNGIKGFEVKEEAKEQTKSFIKKFGDWQGADASKLKRRADESKDLT